MIVKSRFIMSILLSVLLLSACSANPDAANRFEKEIPLIAEVNIPDTLSVSQPETIEIILTQGGQRVRVRTLSITSCGAMTAPCVTL